MGPMLTKILGCDIDIIYFRMKYSRVVSGTFRPFSLETLAKEKMIKLVASFIHRMVLR